MRAKTFPPWIRRSWPARGAFAEVRELLGDLELHTVCQSAHCPNQSECWGRGTATFMVMGNVCTRHCTYCAVNSGHPGELDTKEPGRIAEAVRKLGLRHVVVTSVTRDDLADGGAGHVASVIRKVKEASPGTTIEILVQDFNGDAEAIRTVAEAGAEVFSHNIETVERLHPRMRDRRFSYRGSLNVLRMASELRSDMVIKSALMLGCGESEAEVHQTLRDLLDAGCHAVSMGQYLQPTGRHHEVAEFVTPERFAEYESAAYALGFAFAVAGPFVRSSYRSEALFTSEAIRARLKARTGTAHAH